VTDALLLGLAFGAGIGYWLGRADAWLSPAARQRRETTTIMTTTVLSVSPGDRVVTVAPWRER